MRFFRTAHRDERDWLQGFSQWATDRLNEVPLSDSTNEAYWFGVRLAANMACTPSSRNDARTTVLARVMLDFDANEQLFSEFRVDPDTAHHGYLDAVGVIARFSFAPTMPEPCYAELLAVPWHTEAAALWRMVGHHSRSDRAIWN